MGFVFLKTRNRSGTLMACPTCFTVGYALLVERDVLQCSACDAKYMVFKISDNLPKRKKQVRKKDV